MSVVWDSTAELPWQYWRYPREPEAFRNADWLQRANADLIRELRTHDITMPISVADRLQHAETAGWKLKEDLDSLAAEGREWRELTAKMIKRGECP